MVELKGTEKQVKWAEDIRTVVVKGAKAFLEEKKEDYEDRGTKYTLRKLDEAKKLEACGVDGVQTEKNSKYFIDKFAYILRCMKDYELTAKVREVSLDLVIGYKVKNTLER